MRERILRRLRAAAERREPVEHPGALRPESLEGTALDAFAARFTAAGGEVVVLRSVDEARGWLRRFAGGFDTAAIGALVPDWLRPALPALDPAEAALGVSLALAAVAETGSLLLDGREGRCTQLLPPSHLVWVYSDRVAASLGQAIADAPRAATASLALHSGPSKSADIGGMLVTGVHGPGRVVAAVIDAPGAVDD